MLDQAGIKSTETQLMLGGVITVISFIGALIGSMLVDKVGRRKMLFGASCLFVVWFSIVAALSATYSGTDSKNGSNAVRLSLPPSLELSLELSLPSLPTPPLSFPSLPPSLTSLSPSLPHLPPSLPSLPEQPKLTKGTRPSQ